MSEHEFGGDIPERRQAEQARRRMDDLFRALIENALDVITILDAERVIRYQSSSVERVLGYKPAELIGVNIIELLHPDDVPKVDAAIKAAAPPNGTPGIAQAIEVEVRLRHKDGSWRILESIGKELPGIPSVTGIVVNSRDITERKRAEELARQQSEQLQFLYDTSQQLNRTLDLHEIYQTICNFMSAIVPNDGFVISAFDPETQLITCRAFWMENKWLDVSAFPPIPLEAEGKGTQSIVIRSGQAMLLNDYQAQMKTAQNSYYVNSETNEIEKELLPEEEDITRSALIVPLKSGGMVTGVIQVMSYRLNAYTEDQLKLLEALALHIASAKQNARLYAQVQSELNERKRAEEEIVMLARFPAENPNPILRIEHSGLILYANAVSKQLLSEWSTRVGDYLPMYWQSLVADSVASQTSTIVDVQCGELVYSMLIVPIHDAGYVNLYGRDITERKRAEERIQRQLEHLTALSAIDRVITSNFDLRLSLSEILKHVTTELGIDAADILVLNSSLQMLEFGAGHGFRTKAIERTHLRLGESHAGRAALERHLVHVTNLKDAPDLILTKDLADEGFVGYYAVPLIAKGQVKGVLEVFHRARLNPDEEWLQFLETLAGQVAIAIDSSQMFDGLQRANVELSLAYDATIAGWSQAMDLRDKETEGHSQRVTEMTMRLAKAMGIGDAELVHVRRGALLHDIGKMGVPDNILLKPGSLTDEEWVLMRKHPQLAYELLSPIAYLRDALDIPYCHHEKWDGTGYPRGLRGEQIPLTARIFAVVDVWDALTSDRPYRPAWPKEKVRAHILAGSGTHFDPQVVDAFLVNMDAVSQKKKT